MILRNAAAFTLLATAFGASAFAQSNPLDGIDPGLLKEPVVVNRPSEPKATYTVASVTKNKQGQAVSVNTRYSSATGWVFTKRVYDCGKGTLRTLGDGETFAAMKASRSSSPVTDIVPGSSAADVGVIACNAIGKPLN